MKPSTRMLLALLAIVLVPARGHALDWPMYGRDLKHTFTNTDSLIDSSTAALLQPAWDFATGDAVSAAPAVVDGVVYIGSWDGFFYALDAGSGAVKWTFPVDCDPAVQPIPAHCPGGPSLPVDRVETDGGLITSSAAVVDGKVYFGGGKTMYCLNAADGSLVWKKVICGNPDVPSCEADDADPTRIFSSPAVFKRKVFFGFTPDGADGYRGGFVALDARSGVQRWRFEVDPQLDANGKPIRVGRTVLAQNRGCGPVWSSAAIDERKKLVFFNTGDCGYDAPPPYHEAIIAVKASNGKLKWAYRPRAGDTCDFDFGASPNVIDIGTNFWVGNGGKDGTYYVLNRRTRNRGGELFWASNVVYGGFSGGFIGSTAFDGQRVYGATAFGELGNPNGVCNPSDPRDTVLQQPTMHAFDPATRTVAWQQAGSPGVGASSVAKGVVFAGTQAPPTLRVFAASTGNLVTSFPFTGAVNSSAALVGDSLLGSPGTELEFAL